MKNKKILPYVIFGVPVLIGLFFVYKAIKNRKKGGESDAINKPETNTNTTPAPAPAPTGTTWTKKDELPFKKGNVSPYIAYVQYELGINNDGKFGNETLSKVIAFQKSKKLVADGVVGAKTWKAMFGADFPLLSPYDPSKPEVTPLVYKPQQQQTGSVFGNNPFN